MSEPVVKCLCGHTYEQHDTRTYEDAQPCNVDGCGCDDFGEERAD
jgi:hypothetical protein